MLVKKITYRTIRHITRTFNTKNNKEIYGCTLYAEYKYDSLKNKEKTKVKYFISTSTLNIVLKDAINLWIKNFSLPGNMLNSYYSCPLITSSTPPNSVSSSPLHYLIKFYVLSVIWYLYMYQTKTFSRLIKASGRF